MPHRKNQSNHQGNEPKKPTPASNASINSEEQAKHRLPQFKRPKMPRPRLPFHRPSIKEVVRETTSGGIVFRRNSDGQPEILLIQDAKNRWTIPKGHVEPGEEPGATAEREIREETGLQQMEVYNELGKVNFRYRRLDALILMTMHIWLVEGKGETNKLDPEDWLNGIKWFPAATAVDRIAYDDIGKLILLAMKQIRKHSY